MTSGLTKASDLQVSVDRSNDGTLVRLRGRLSIESSPAFRDQLLALLKTRSTKVVVVDMNELSYIEASGIATLVEGLKIALTCHNILSLRGLQGRVLHLFEVTGLLDLFDNNGGRNASTASKES